MPTPARPVETGSFNKLDRPIAEPRRTAVQQEIIDKIAQRGLVAPCATANNNHNATSAEKTAPSSYNFENDILAKFKARAEAKEKDKENVKVIEKTTEAFPTFEECCGEFPSNTTPETPTSKTNNGSAFITATKDSLSPNAMAFVPSSPIMVQSSPNQNVEVNPPVGESQFKITVNPITADKACAEWNSEAAAPVKAGLQNTEAFTAGKPPQAPLDSAKTELIAKTGRLSISVKEPGSLEEAPAIIVTSSEGGAERENATHFTSWGIPQARTTPRKSFFDDC